jgi:hypothetical protein
MDRDLVEAARQGDREAYAALVRARGDRLYALAQRILRDVDRVEDALQEALAAAWRDLPGLREPDRFDAWLHRLVVRACVLEASRERRRVSIVDVLLIDVPTSHDDFLNVADRDQLERRNTEPAGVRAPLDIFAGPDGSAIVSLNTTGEARARYVLFDRGDGGLLLIDIGADGGTWDQVIASAMPIVDSFRFNR